MPYDFELSHLEDLYYKYNRFLAWIEAADSKSILVHDEKTKAELLAYFENCKSRTKNRIKRHKEANKARRIKY